MTISVKALKELLAMLPDDARLHGYEGEDTGITVNLPDGDFTWIRAREGTQDDEHNTNGGVYARYFGSARVRAHKTMSSLSFWLGYRNVSYKLKVLARVIHADMGIKLHYSENVHLGQQTVGGVQTKNLPA